MPASTGDGSAVCLRLDHLCLPYFFLVTRAGLWMGFGWAAGRAG